MSANNLEDFFSQFGDSILKKLKEKSYEKVEARIGPAFNLIIESLADISGRDELADMHFNCVRHEAIDLVKYLLRDQDGKFQELSEFDQTYAQDEQRFSVSAKRTRDTALANTFTVLRHALVELLVEQEVATQTKQLVSTVAATLNTELGTEIPAQSEKNSDTAPGM